MMSPNNHWRANFALAGLLALVLALAAGCGWYSKTVDWVGELWDSQDTGLRKRVTAAPFFSRLEGLDPTAKAIGVKVTEGLDKAGGVVLVGYDDVVAASREAAPEVKGTRERLLAAGRRLGVVTLLTGSLTDLSLERKLTGIYGFRDNDPFLVMELDATMVDVASGVVLADKAFHVQVELTTIQAENIQNGETPPRELVSQLAAEVVEPVLDWCQDNIAMQRWAGYILSLEGGRIKTTVGRDTGLPTGAELVVYGAGQKITAGSGQTLHLPGSPVGRVRLVELESRTAWAVPVAGEEGQPSGPYAEGMVLRTH